ncbi:MAG: hypothetical protein HYT93_02240 [Parcubacteria group bacterium]|nr:hypothetical protein [Parcubacteria group bacterium]
MSHVDIDACIAFSKEGVTRCEKMIMEMFGDGGCCIAQSFALAKQRHLLNIELLEELKQKYENLNDLQKQALIQSFLAKIITEFHTDVLKRKIEILERTIIRLLPEAAQKFVHTTPKAA